jgi:hypothetical protein
MLSGVTGGVFPPPPQASSNPDRKKLDTKARELNRITSSQSVRKASLSHSAFVERVPGARAAFAGDACRGCLWNGAPAECGKRSTHSRTSRNTLFPSVVACKHYVEAKVQMDSRRRSRPHVTRQQGNRGKKSPGETRPRQAPFCPCFVCFAGIQPITAMPSRRNSLDAKLMTSIFQGISTRSSARCQRSW